MPFVSGINRQEEYCLSLAWALASRYQSIVHPHTRSARREQQLCSAVSLHGYLCPGSSMEVPRIGSGPSTQKELAGDPPLTDLATAGVWVLFTHLPHHPGPQRPALFLGYLLQLVRPFQKVLFLYLAEIEGTIHLVRHSSLQPLLELLFRVRFVLEAPTLPPFPEALLFFSAC